MRHMKGTRGPGLAGMTPCRKWGMGSSSDTDALRWFGLGGMTRWIVRPLLTVPKVQFVWLPESKLGMTVSGTLYSDLS
jgi:tRNA(Ile)-lysidine synthase